MRAASYPFAEATWGDMPLLCLSCRRLSTAFSRELISIDDLIESSCGSLRDAAPTGLHRLA